MHTIASVRSPCQRTTVGFTSGLSPSARSNLVWHLAVAIRAFGYPGIHIELDVQRAPPCLAIDALLAGR